MRSRVQRGAYYERALSQLSQHTYVLALQGFLFFGTAHRVLQQVRQRMDDSGAISLRFLVLDFAHVTGFDSSFTFILTKLHTLTAENTFSLIFTGLSPHMEQKLRQRGRLNDAAITVFPDLDHGLEWCEDQLLDQDQLTHLHVPVTLALQLADSGFPLDASTRLLAYLERRALLPGDYLIHQGDASDALYFIELGQVSIYLQRDGHPPLRLQTSSIGTIVGELGFFLNETRSASVIADEHTRVYRLSQGQFEAMQQQDAALAKVFHTWMLHVLSGRLRTMNTLLAGAPS